MYIHIYTIIYVYDAFMHPHIHLHSYIVHDNQNTYNCKLTHAITHTHTLAQTQPIINTPISKHNTCILTLIIKTHTCK